MAKISMLAARVNAGLSQAQIAKKLHMQVATYSRYERRIASIRFDDGIKFAEIVNLPVEMIDFSLPSKLA